MTNKNEVNFDAYPVVSFQLYIYKKPKASSTFANSSTLFCFLIVEREKEKLCETNARFNIDDCNEKRID